MIFDGFQIGMLLLGGFVGGFVSGLSGFGLALSAMPFWIQAMAPPSAASLATASSVFSQAQSMHLVWGAVKWRRVAPFVVAGLAGVPFGTVLLPHIDVRLFKLGIGIVLVVYCGFQLAVRKVGAHGLSTEQGWLPDAVVGFGGGVLGGLAGLSGPLPTMWATFKPWDRHEKRAMFQVYNSAILLMSFCLLALSGLLPTGFWLMLLLSVPATIAGVWLGAALYRRLDDRRFDDVVMALLMTMGAGLIVSSL